MKTSRFYSPNDFYFWKGIENMLIKLQDEDQQPQNIYPSTTFMFLEKTNLLLPADEVWGLSPFFCTH